MDWEMLSGSLADALEANDPLDVELCDMVNCVYEAYRISAEPFRDDDEELALIFWWILSGEVPDED